MKYNIKVITKAKEEKILQNKDFLKIYLNQIPIQGKANKKLIKLLSDYFNVSKSSVKIISGEKSHEKVIEINE